LQHRSSPPVHNFPSPSPLPHTARTISVLAHRPDSHADRFGQFVGRGDVLFAQGGEEDVGAGEGVFEGVVVGEGELEMVGDGVELVVFEMGPCFRGDFVGAEVAGRGVWDAVELEDVPEGGHVEGGVVGNDEGVLDAGEDFFGVEGVEADGVADHAGLDAVDQDVEVVEVIVADVGADEPVFALDDLAVFDDDEADGADAAVPAVGGLKVQGGESHGGSFRGGGRGCGGGVREAARFSHAIIADAPSLLKKLPVFFNKELLWGILLKVSLIRIVVCACGRDGATVGSIIESCLFLFCYYVYIIL